jgi:hypothetical protein
MPVDQVRQGGVERAAARGPHDVADKKDIQES